MRMALLAALTISLALVATARATERYSRTEPIATQPVVSDAVTHLMWQGCAGGQTGPDCSTPDAATAMTWQQALNYCQVSTWSGFTDWRLPDIRELSAIVDDMRWQMAIDPRFSRTPGDFWSSTPASEPPGLAWSVNFEFGYTRYVHKGNAMFVRCARSES